MFGRFIAIGCVLAGVACEDMPTDADEMSVLQEVRAGSTGSTVSLRDLFGAALVRIRRAEGEDSATAITSRWRAITTGADSARTARLLEVQTALRAFGPRIADHAIAAVRAEQKAAVDLTQRFLSSGNGAAVRSSVSNAERDLLRAEALRRTSPSESLLAVALAAEQLDGARRAALRADRLPVLDELFENAVQSTRSAHGPAAADLLLDGQRRLSGDVIDDDDRSEVHRRLQHVRDYQSRAYVESAGQTAVGDYITRLESIRQETEALLKRLPDNTEAARARRMHATVADMSIRARSALQKGEAVLAIDLATHAAGLLNTLRETLAR
jgi:hypothetical protein